MKSEFLQNFKIGDQPLTKEIIDAILAENDRDIEAAKKPFADYDTIKNQLTAAQDTLKGFEGQDIESIRKAAQDWEKKYNDAIAEHQKKMDDLTFEGVMKDAITAAKGRNAAAIMAVMGAEQIAALKSSKNQANDIKTALENLQKDNGYLFGDDGGTPPPYAAGTGAGSFQNQAKGNFNFGFTGIRAKPAEK